MKFIDRSIFKLVIIFLLNPRKDVMLWFFHGLHKL